MAEPRKFQPALQALTGRVRSSLTPRPDDLFVRRDRLPDPELRMVYKILDFALRVGGLLLASGAATVEVESTILDVTRGCGLDSCEVDVTFTSMTASFVRSDDVEPITALQVVRHRSVDCGRLAAVYLLRSDLLDGRISPEEAFERFESIVVQPRRRPWFVVAGWAGMAAAFTVLLGGGALVASVSFVSTAAVYVFNRRMSRWGMPDFFLAAIGSAVATAFALLLMAVHAPASPSYVVAGGIMALVPGYSLVASVQDAVTGFPISGGARGLEVLLTAAGIISGVAAAIYAAVSLGLDLRLRPLSLTSAIHLPVQVVAAGVAALLYAAATNVPRRRLWAAGLNGALGWTAYLLVHRAGGSPIFSTVVAAVVVGAGGSLLASRQRTHPFLYIVAGVMPLVPGLTIYQGMLEMFTGQGSGPETLLRALAIGLAIAAGVLLGGMLLRSSRKSLLATDRYHSAVPVGIPDPSTAPISGPSSVATGSSAS